MANKMENVASYDAKKANLLHEIQLRPPQGISLKKKTASNLFRYIPAKKEHKNNFVIKHFDNIISIDEKNGILDVEGLTSYEKIVQFTLQYGFLPTVAPELKHITIGGAIVGIGIESTCFKYGFVHDGLLEAEVLLPNGQIVLCQPNNAYSDLFFALPNSYGTLGYILRAKIKLYKASTFVHIKTKRFSNASLFIDAMLEATQNNSIQFIEGLAFSQNEFYLLIGDFVSNVEQTDDIYRKHIFYKLIKNKSDIYLSTQDYIFRYDPDWFWNIPETLVYNMFRRIAPLKYRNSGFYKKYIDTKRKLFHWFGIQTAFNQSEESLIQDWEVPWEKGLALLKFALSNVDINGMPWAVVPIKPQMTASLYPLKPNTLYFNLGCYCSSKRVVNKDPFFNTKIMDEYCFSLGGLKMLYSSTMLSKEQFNAIYNGVCYQHLKQKYDPNNLAGLLYEKVAG